MGKDSPENFTMYIEKLQVVQHSYMPLPFLMAKKVEKTNLKSLSLKITNDFYETEDFAPVIFYKSGCASLPEKVLDEIYNGSKQE